MLLAVAALLCAFLIGFTAQRASLCNVRAVSQALEKHDLSMLSALLQAVAWSAVASGVLVIVAGVRPAATAVHLRLELAAIGGLLFGVGAALNGGCSLSTLYRLINGEMSMLGALAGVLLGGATVGASLSFVTEPWLTSLQSPWLRWPEGAIYVLLALMVWGSWRGWRLLREHQTSAYGSEVREILWPNQVLPVISLVLGLSAGALYATQGAWTYSNLLRSLALAPWSESTTITAWHSGLVATVIAGAATCAWRRRSFALRRVTSIRALARHVAAGWLMGVGAALVPGGNDTLLLAGLPALSLSALVSYISLLVGIAVTLVLIKRVESSGPAALQRSTGRLLKSVEVSQRDSRQLKLASTSALVHHFSRDTTKEESAWPSCGTPAKSCGIPRRPR